jgi:F0F1-type ATP synthase assembly protein I
MIMSQQFWAGVVVGVILLWILQKYVLAPKRAQ